MKRVIMIDSLAGYTEQRWFRLQHQRMVFGLGVRMGTSPWPLRERPCSQGWFRGTPRRRGTNQNRTGSMLTRRSLTLGAACVALAAPASAGDASATAFVTAIYNSYKGKDSKGV